MWFVRFVFAICPRFAHFIPSCAPSCAVSGRAVASYMACEPVSPSVLQDLLQETVRAWRGLPIAACLKALAIRAGQHVVERLIDRGGFGTVYLVRQVGSGELLAAKAFDKARMQELGMMTRVRNEVHVLARMRHSHIVRYHVSGSALQDVRRACARCASTRARYATRILIPSPLRQSHCEDRRTLCILMEWCSGGNLYQELARRGALTEQEARGLFGQVELFAVLP